MKITRTCAAAVVAAAMATTVTAGPIDTMKVIAKEGIWELRQGKDAFSDKSSCVMTVATKPYIQIDSGAFSVSYRGRGGVQGYQVRLDEEPEGKMQLPNAIEKQGGFLIWQGDAFETVMKAKRVRIQVVTVLPSMVTDDIDMKGAPRLYARLLQLCPEEPAKPKR